jgi:uncharacterized membrane protein YsdA (DUF1294 family)
MGVVSFMLHVDDKLRARKKKLRIGHKKITWTQALEAGVAFYEEAARRGELQKYLEAKHD